MPLLPPAAIGGTRAAPSTAPATVYSDAVSYGEAIVDRTYTTHLIKAGAHLGDFQEFYGCGGRFSDSYQVGQKIGEGGFGKVFEVKHKVLGISRAVKRLSKAQSRGDSRKNELAALRSLDHPHIVKLVEYYDEDGYFYLVFELCRGPDLLDRIMKDPRGRMSEYEASVALRHMLKAVQCCHSQYRGHYDIKPENFMYTNPECKSLMMIDLGLSSGFGRRDRIKGTAQYMAPECWGGTYGPEGDIWSCGVVLYVMLTGRAFMANLTPEQLKRETQSRILLRESLDEAARTFELSQDAQDLLTMMLQHDRHARPTVREVLRHRFVVQSYTLDNVGSQRVQQEAYSVRQRLVDTWRAVAQEPLLKRVARMAMAHCCDLASVELEPIRMAFRQMDQFGYGELSIFVLEKGLQEMGSPVPEDFDDVFEGMDTNRDGYISYLTFLSTMLPFSMRTNEGLCRVTFATFDHNKDGVIDAGDVATVFGHRRESDHIRRLLFEVCEAGRLTQDRFMQMMAGECLS